MPADEPADGLLPDVSGWLGRSGTIVTSPARRCRVEGAPVDARLGSWDLGTWTGRSWDELDLAAWRGDAAFDAHGGESLEALIVRVSALLDHWRTRDGRVAAVTHAAVIKAAVVVALGAPPTAAWDVDVAPGSFTELHTSGAGWRVVRVNCR